MITTQGKEAIAKSIELFLTHAEMTFEGAPRTVAIHKVEITGNKIRILVYFDDLVTGTITKIILLDNMGRIFLEKQDITTKTDMQGIMFAFDINIQEVV
ncbi:MAG: hypothetical protein COA82_06580 [Alkaliphilus sp.]|nr:hypothetical protein [Alkaliphilus sp. AH-315-G20]MBN4074827.1 hypothetical protein [bacterium AH-315-E09]PHS34890.1 MAG: hypothetical protein COA82_06580 [Alkaliphilus sp.]